MTVAPRRRMIVPVKRTTIGDLFDVPDLHRAVEAGHVRSQTHPKLPLRVYNYTELAAFERIWNQVTLTCRGLIVDEETGRVVARPFRKFFNHTEPGAPELDLSAPVTVTDKLDGSLGVLFPTPDGHAIATRGSFTSDQALHATAVWQERYADRAEIDGDWTLLFEIIYPGNRIVCDYRGMDDLVLLGAVNIDTGTTRAPDDVTGWPGPRAETFSYATLGEALSAPPRAGKEGYVIEVRGGADRIKLKQEDYVALHRIVTGLNARVVWEHLAASLPLEELLTPLPEEFHPWVIDVAEQLSGQVASICRDADDEHRRILARLPDGWTRKDYAMVAKDSDRRGYLFRLLDRKPIVGSAWRAVRPEGNWTPANLPGEEAA